MTEVAALLELVEAVRNGSLKQVEAAIVACGMPFAPLPASLWAPHFRFTQELHTWLAELAASATACFAALWQGKATTRRLRVITTNHGVAPIRRRLEAFLVSPPLSLLSHFLTSSQVHPSASRAVVAALRLELAPIAQEAMEEGQGAEVGKPKKRKHSE